MPTQIPKLIVPEYVSLESKLAEPIAWCPPSSTGEDTTLFVVVKHGHKNARALQLVAGRALDVDIKKLPFKSALVQSKQVSRQIFRATSKVFTHLGAFLIISVLLATASGSLSIRNVLTASMSGTFEPGDVVVAANWVQPKVRDIAIYKAEDFQGNFRAEFVHRIVGNDVNAGTFSFKGDNNPKVDPLPVPYENVVGTVLFWVPNLGALVDPRMTLILLAIAVFAYLAIQYIRDGLLERRLERSSDR